MSGDKKPNNRKQRGASKMVSEQLIVSKLHEAGFIKSVGEGEYLINESTDIEDRWGTHGMPNDTTKDIREILRRLSKGLEKNGAKVNLSLVSQKKDKGIVQ